MIDLRNSEANTLLVVLALQLAVLVWMLISFFEARAFNAATGSDISTWQAMFMSLRVQEAPVR